MSYDVGQIVFLLNNETLTIVPGLVVEEIVRKTLSEQTKQHVVKLPSKKEERIILENITEHVFSDVNKLRDHMLENTRISIDKLIKNAVDKKEIFFGQNLNGQVELDLTSSSEDVNKKPDQPHVQKDIKQVIMNNDDKNKTLNSEEK